jgi:peptide/nickel transport system substrate-binding protein
LKKYSCMLLSIILLILFALVGCSNDVSKEGEAKKPENKTGEPQNGGEITVAQGAAVQSFDPLRSVSGADYSYFYLVYDTLIDLDADGKAVPNLVKEWEFPDDKTILLHLQENVKFHDGTPFDGEAVKWNLERANAEGSNTKDLANIQSIDVIDKTTVKLNLSQPDASIILVLSDRPGTIISPTASEKYGDDYHLHPVGTGPFKVTKHISNQEVVYENNGDYWKERKPYLDKITFKVMSDANTVMNALQAGEIQVSGIAATSINVFEKDPKFTVNIAEQLVYWTLHLNTSKQPLDNPKVRQAIKYGIDKEAMNKVINMGYGKVASQTFPEGYVAYNPDVKTEYNPEKAKQLLKESGVSNPEIEIIHFADVPGWDTAAEIIADQLKDIGFKVKLVPMEVNASLAKWFEGSSFSLVASWSGRNDPLQTLSNLYAENGPTNIGKTAPPGMEELMKKARENYDPSERAKVFKEIVAAADEYVYSVPLFYLPQIIVTSKEVKGYKNHFIKKPDFSYLYLEK